MLFGIYHRLNLTVSSPVFVDTNIADAVQIGLLGSLFSIFFAFGRLVNGYISDSQPAWKMISVGLIISGISNLLIGFLPPFLVIAVLWSSNAYAQSILWSSVLCAVSSVYDETTAKKKASYMVTSVTTGNILGIVVNTWIISKFGLNYAFIIPGIILLIAAIFVFLIMRNIKPKSEKKTYLLFAFAKK